MVATSRRGRAGAPTVICTIGHGTLSEARFLDVVKEADVEEIADVRSFPGSRRNPQHGQDQMREWLAAAGLAYSWLPDLGGRRRGADGSPHLALRHPSFRAYADHMDTPEFDRGVAELLASTRSKAVMCSESVWWRCHRRLLADHLVLVRGIDVVHLMHDGRRTPHHPTDGVRLAGGTLVYDGRDPAA